MRGEVIPDLYCAGESQGGFAQHGLARCLVFGRIAGRHRGEEHGLSAMTADTARRPQQTRHETSLAVWDIPAAIAAGERFAVKVGAKSSAGCALGGRRIEVLDGERVVASGPLGDAPWPGTGALFWSRGRACARRRRRGRHAVGALRCGAISTSRIGTPRRRSTCRSSRGPSTR